MYDHNINEMAELLVKNRLVKENKLGAAVDALKSYWVDKIADVWTVADAYKAANDAGRVLCESEACDMLQRVFQKFDASIGISWDTLQTWAEDFGRKMTPEEDEKFSESGDTISDPERPETAVVHAES